MNLGLGTVQFGLDYGISNRSGKTPESGVIQILELAERGGVAVIDTAAAYGDSEDVLGNTLRAGHPFRIVTKTPAFRTTQLTAGHASQLRDVFQTSLAKLRQRRIHGLLAHHADDLLSPGGELLFGIMQSLKAEGLVEKIGVSVYTGAQIDAVMGRFQIDLVQLPLNVLDQRLISGGHLSRLKKARVEVHARSAFLQGLLLLSPKDVPEKLRTRAPQLPLFHAMAKRAGATPAQAALKFISLLPEVDVAIVGVNDQAQLRELLDYDACQIPTEDFQSLASGDEILLDPSRWELA